MRKGVAAMAALVLMLATRQSLANGRFPATMSVHLGGDGEATKVVGATFGLLLSQGGAPYRWVCEDALGYGGEYDPSYAVANDGSMWMTSFDGVRVSRDDGCTWTPIGSPFDQLFPGALTIDADGRLWAVTAQAGMSNNVYRNDDPSAGNSFAPLSFAGDAGSILTSIAVAPGDPTRAYAGGFVIPPDAGDPYPILYRTSNDGASWTSLPTGTFVPGAQPQVLVEAISPTDPDLLFVRVGRSVAAGGDVLYRSDDGGDSFAPVLTVPGEIVSVLVRGSGHVLVGLGDVGAMRSTDGGQSFSAIDGAPQLRCAVETAQGTLLGCANNGEPDRAALASSSDALSWSSVMRFSDIAGPLDCPSGTEQRDTCAELVWPGLAEQLGLGDAGPEVDGGMTRPPNDGCGCRAQGEPTPGLAIPMLFLTAVAARRRSRAGGCRRRRCGSRR